MSIDHRSEFVSGLRAVADAIESNEDLLLPGFGNIDISFQPEYAWDPEDDKKNVKILTRAFRKAFPGDIQKTYSDHAVQLIQNLTSNVKVSCYFSRSDICEKVQVGTKTEVVKELPEGVSMIEVEKEVPVYEWKCTESLLS